MYHAIVRRRIRALFAAINRGDAEPVLASFARRFEHAFLGEHALGGARHTLPASLLPPAASPPRPPPRPPPPPPPPRHTLPATRRWYERLYRLLPDIHFDLRQIEVSGPPWNTTVVVDWDETN